MEKEIKKTLENGWEKKSWEDYLQKWYEVNKGNIVLLFGRPFTGKSTFAVALARKLGDYIYFAVDSTIPAPEDLKLTPVSSWKDLRVKIAELKELPKLIVIDSITTLATEFYGDKLLSPRANLLLARFYDEVFRKLAKLRGKTTVLVIAHEALKAFTEDGTGIVGPRINENALRHIDRIYRAIRNGGYKIVKWMERKPVEAPKFYIEV